MDLLVFFFLAYASTEMGFFYNKWSSMLCSIMRSSSRCEWWCWKTKILYVWDFRCCFVTPIFDLLSWLSWGELSSQYLPDCYGLDHGDSYSRLPNDANQVVRLFPMSYCCLYSSLCWLTTSWVMCVHVALKLRRKLKLWETIYCYL
jgi:hypothetical protein